MSYANNKGADQPAHPRRLISTFIVRCLDGIISLVSISEMSRLWLASVAEHAGLSLTWSQTPKTDFLVTGLQYKPDTHTCNLIHVSLIVRPKTRHQRMEYKYTVIFMYFRDMAFTEYAMLSSVS